MQKLGFTRTSVKRTHALYTPDGFIRAPWVGFTNATCIVHINPTLGTGFTMYTVEAEQNGQFGPVPEGTSRFVYVTTGKIKLTLGKKSRVLGPHQFAYLPPDCQHSLVSNSKSVTVVVEKPYALTAGVPVPKILVGDAKKQKAEAINQDPGLMVRHLLPDIMPFDFQMNTMTFAPGASLHLVETHVMEHGLVMLSGGGIYRLDEDWYSVTAGDVIYMAPYCPQWFGALGKTPSVYLLYKDWNRHPFQ